MPQKRYQIKDQKLIKIMKEKSKLKKITKKNQKQNVTKNLE